MAGDTRLLKASLRGDHDAFARIVRRYQSLVCAVTYSATGDLAASEDLAQDTFLTAWQRLDSLREPSRLRSWLCAIARNRTTDYLRRRRRDAAADAVSVEEAPAVESALPSPAEQAAARERERLVWDALSEMPDIYRFPLVLYYREDQSIRKVARALDLSHSAVKLRLMRGRGMLRDRMAALVEDTLSTTAPGGAFAAAVLAGLAGTAAKQGAGAGTTILGLSLAKAAAVGVLAAGVAVGAAVALRAPPPAPAPIPAVAAVPVVEPKPAASSWPVYTDKMSDDLLALVEMDIRQWQHLLAAVVPLTGSQPGVPPLSELVLQICHTNDLASVDLTRPVYGITADVGNVGGVPYVFRLADPERYARSLTGLQHKVDGEENLYIEGPEETGTVIVILGDRAVVTTGGVARARRAVELVRQGAVPSEPCFGPYGIAMAVNAQPILAERAKPGDRDNPFNGLRERLGITRNGAPAGPHPLAHLVDGLEDVCLRQWDRYVLAAGIGDEDLSGLWQFRTIGGTPLQRAFADYPAGPVGLLRFVPADPLAVLACKLPDVASLLTGAGVPADSLPGRALGLLGDEAAVAFGASPEGTIRLLLALRVRDPAGAGQLVDQVAAMVSASLAGPGAPIRLTRSERQHNGQPIKVWDFDVDQTPGRTIGINFVLGKDLKLYECLAGDVLLLAFGDDVLPQVEAALDGTLASFAESPRFAEAMSGMPAKAPLVCCIEVEKLFAWLAQTFGSAVPPLQGLDFGEGPPVVLAAHAIEGRIAELRVRVPLSAVAAGVKWRKAFPPPPRPAAPAPAPLPPPPVTDLHGAARQGDLGRVKQFLADGADVNAEDARRRTPLHEAAQQGHRAVVEALLDAGAHVNATDLEGRTPTGLAVQAGHEEVADLLRRHGGVE